MSGLLVLSNHAMQLNWQEYMVQWMGYCVGRNHLKVAGSIPTTGKNGWKYLLWLNFCTWSCLTESEHSPCSSNKGFLSRFCVGSWVQHEMPKEGQRTHWPKRCMCNNEDEVGHSNIPSYNNYQASSQKFRQIIGN